MGNKQGAPVVLLGLLLSLAATALPTVAHAVQNDASKFIAGVKDSEDLVRIEGTDWVIASGRKAPGQDDPGHLYLINITTGEAEAIYPDVKANQPTGELGASCAGAPDSYNFEAHGLGISPGFVGHYRLFVVNHAIPAGGRESVELFAVNAQGAKPVITWSDCVVMPEHTWGNDVVALPDGGFAVSNFMDPGDKDLMGKLERGEDTGNVLEWHKDKGFSEVPHSEMSGPNGIETDPKGRYYFVSAWGTKELVRISRGADPVKRLAAKTGVLSDKNAWT